MANSPQAFLGSRSRGRDCGAGTGCKSGAAPGKKKKEGLPPKVQETVGDLSFVLSRGEMKVEGVGLVVGWITRALTPRRRGIASNSSTR